MVNTQSASYTKTCGTFHWASLCVPRTYHILSIHRVTISTVMSLVPTHEVGYHVRVCVSVCIVMS